MSIPSAQHPIYRDALRVDLTRWSGTWQNRLAEVTTSANTGTRYANVAEDNQWRFEMPMDDPQYPEVLGFTRGTIISAIYFEHSSLSDKLVQTTVESCEKVVDSTSDVPRVVVTGRGGNLYPNVAVGS